MSFNIKLLYYYHALITVTIYVKSMLLNLVISESTINYLKIPDDDEEIPIDSFDEFDDDNEEWMKEAILDVAYYIRSHKFNNYDRRFVFIIDQY